MSMGKFATTNERRAEPRARGRSAEKAWMVATLALGVAAAATACGSPSEKGSGGTGTGGTGATSAQGGTSSGGSATGGTASGGSTTGGSAGAGGSGNQIQAASCSAPDVNAAIAKAVPGDTVVIPPGGADGSCLWGDTTQTVGVDRAITLRGSGTASTLIKSRSGTALLVAADDAVIANFQIASDAESKSPTLVSIGSNVRWRITGMRLDGTVAMYVIIVNGGVPATSDTFGLIDGNELVNLNGEQLFFRGPCNTWSAPSNLGGAATMFMENNSFSAMQGQSAYVDFNANTRVVARFNDFDGTYLDAHGSWSDYDVCQSDYHESARQLEIYANHFKGNLGWTSVYVRGGTGLVYDNVVDASVDHGFLFLDEYYVRTGHLMQADWMYYPSACACAPDYPVVYQVGRGKTASLPAKKGADQGAEPMFLWNNTKGGAPLSIDTNPYGGPSTDCKAFCNDQNLSVSTFIQDGRDFCTHSTATPCNGYDLTAYAAYTCPHPMAGAGKCDSKSAGKSGYMLGK